MPEPLPNPFAGLDLLSSTVVLLDEDFAILYMNSAAENLLAISSKAVAGCRLDSVVDCPAALGDALDSALRHGWSYTGQSIELRRNDGLALHLNCTVIIRPRRRGARLLVELWPIDQQLKATREERLLEQQIASRELIRNLAHEIKNPLGGIRGAAQLLERELNNPGLREYTQVIIKETDRLQDLMKRLLSPHRPMQPGPVNIHEILERVRSLLTAEFPQTLSVRRDYDTSLPELVGEPRAADSGGAQYRSQCRPGDQGTVERRARFGQITLRTRAARQVTLAKRRYRLALDLQVIDNGPGIPDDIRERMFYPLVSGREGGNGLGLTLAQSFVQQHQGTIECESRPGIPVSRFACLLSACNGKLIAIASVCLQFMKSGKSMKPVWIVDDDKSIRWVLEKTLSREQVPFKSFASASEALAQLDLGAEPPQVLVSDIRMPGESGLDMLKKVKERFPSPAGHHHDRLLGSGQRGRCFSGRSVRVSAQTLRCRSSAGVDPPGD